MLDPENQNDRRARPRSLLSLSAPAAAVSAPVGQAPDAAELHRLARSRREARPSPLLAALARSDGPRPEPVSPEPRPESAHSSPPAEIPRPGVGDRLREHWARARHALNAEARPETGQAGQAPAADPVAVVPVPVPAANPPDLYWRPLIDPMKVVGGIAGSRRLILATTVLGAMIGVLIALNTPKKYQAWAEILVDPRELQIVERDVTGGGLPSDATLAIVENQVRVLTSGTVLNKVVERLNLAQDPEFNGQAGGLSIRGLLSGLRSLISGGGGPDGEDARWTLAVNNLAESLSVSRGDKTFVISIGATTRDPEKSAEIANTLTEVFLETSGEIQAGTAGRATDELTSRLEELREGVEKAERAVEKFKAENDIIDAQGRLITDDEIVKLNDQLSIARARTIELNARAESARSVNLDAVLEGSLPEQVNSSAMTELRTQYASLRQEVDRLATRLGPRHPQRIAAEAQLAGAREQLQAELRRIVSSIQVDLKRAVQLEQDLAARLAQLKAAQAGLSEEMVTLRELERDAASKRSVYEAFLLRARETSEQQSLNTANMSVISKAHPPLLPTGPSRSMIALTGALLGFLTGVALGGARGAVASLREKGRTREPAPVMPLVAVAAPPPVRAEPAAPPPAGADRRFAPPPPEAPAPAYPRVPMSLFPRAHSGWDSTFPQEDRPRPVGYFASEPYPRARQHPEPLDEIRDELREFRAAVRDLAERRRYARDF